MRLWNSDIGYDMGQAEFGLVGEWWGSVEGDLSHGMVELLCRKWGDFSPSRPVIPVQSNRVFLFGDLNETNIQVQSIC